MAQHEPRRGRHAAPPKTTSSSYGDTRPVYEDVRYPQANDVRRSQASNVRYPQANDVRYSQMSAGRPRNYRDSRRKKNPVGKVVAGFVVVLFLAVVAVGGLCAYQANELLAESKVASTVANSAVKSISSLDFDKAKSDASKLSSSAKKVRDVLSQPQWTVVSLLPVVGKDVTSLRNMSEVLVDCSTNALEPLVASLSGASLDTLLTNGSINLVAMQSLLDSVSTVAPVLARDEAALSSIGTFNISQLNDKITPLVGKFSALNEVVQKAANLAPVASDILGANGKRTYLIAAQNTAEIRSTGGFLGSVSTITFDNGSFELGDFDTPYNCLDQQTSGVVVDDNEIELFGTRMNYSWDMGYDPNFPTAAMAWKTSYQDHNGVQIDGVLSLTPSMVQDVLALVGSITLSDGTVLDGTNASKVIEHDLYWTYLSGSKYTKESADYVDDLFGEAAEKAFDKLFDNMNSKTMFGFINAMLKGMSDYRVLFWIEDEGLQARIASLNCSGALVPGSGVNQAGVFFCSTGDKLGWYVDIDTAITGATRNSDGSVTYSLTSTFTCSVPQDEIANAGRYIGGAETNPLCALRPSIYIYAPQNATFDSFECSGCVFKEGVHNGLQLFYDNEFSVMPPNTPVVCTYSITVPKGSADLTVRTTPTMTSYR